MGTIFSYLALATTLPLAAVAGTVAQDAPARGAAVHQRFLSDGASVVTTAAGPVCLSSRRIDISASDYRDSDGAAVAFADVIRSPATVIQAIGDAGGALSFRIQLKFSPRPGAPLTLALPGGTQDVSGLLEPSTDSLLIEGALAQDLVKALGEGDRPVLRSLSRDTGHIVTDRIDTPDLAALDGCISTLAAPQVGDVGDTPSTVVRAVFDAQPSPDAIATTGQLQACGMADRPETLYLGRLRSLSGFVSHTDKIFVSFNAAGQVERAYIPGIFDADLCAGQDSMRVSRAADGNVPAASNQVSGCIGAERMEVCSSDLGNGVHALTACVADGLTDVLSSRDIPSAVTPPVWIGVPTPSIATNIRRPLPPGGFGGGFGGGSGGSTTPPSDPPGTTPPTGDLELFSTTSSMYQKGETPPIPPLSPVPLPGGLWLALLALGSLLGLRTRRKPA